MGLVDVAEDVEPRTLLLNGAPEVLTSDVSPVVRPVQDPDRGARFCAVLGILGVLDIPIIHKSVEWWGGIHPPAVVSKGALTGEMLVAFLIMTTAWLFLFSGILYLENF